MEKPSYDTLHQAQEHLESVRCEIDHFLEKGGYPIATFQLLQNKRAKAILQVRRIEESLRGEQGDVPSLASQEVTK